ncbi:MAG TPA: 6-phosphofructokinase [Myxococcota bacterium]|nr:6-phosphofructokinase [Myxococcota bacterium]
METIFTNGGTKNMDPVKGNAIIGQSGGPTAVINQSLVGVVEAAKASGKIGQFFGARHGVKGILGEDFVHLFDEPVDVLEQVAMTPSSALGSVRKKPTRDECLAMFEVMKKRDIHYFFYIGGNDSAETTHIIQQVAQDSGYDLACWHVPKTVDNDLRVTDHCPGYGSAARFVASAFMGDNLDNRSLPGIKINVVMGRHAGFLTAASALGRKYPDDGPHLIYMPERPITRDQIVEEIAAVYKRLGRCVVAVSEGIVDANSKDHLTFTEVIAQGNELARDTHGNVQLSGSGALGDWLMDQVKQALGGSIRVRADTFGYLQRSFPGVISPTDAAEARMCGKKAVEFALSGMGSGSVAMIRKPGPDYAIEYKPTELQNVAKETRGMPGEYICEKGNDVTKAFIDYASPLIGELPPYGRLKGMI